MNIYHNIVLLPALVLGLFITGCAGNSNENGTAGSQAEATYQADKPVYAGSETSLLLDYLVENGDYVNSRQFPSLIKAQDLNELLGSNILVIDIRNEQDYSEGHIKGSLHQEFGNLPGYFETGIKPSDYDRIVIVSSDGQLASYTTSLLRLMGYGNVYTLRWGMSGWNVRFANKGWFSGCSSTFQERLETRVNNTPEATTMPVLNTGYTTGKNVGASRFKTLFDEGTDSILIDAADLFADPSSYYIINYDRRDKYESGHIPGAVRYKPGATLGMVDVMATIPADKHVVVYCGTGHNSGFVTAYLRLFGYNARSLNYGNNSFMYDRLVSEKETLSWIPFTSADVNDFEVVK